MKDSQLDATQHQEHSKQIKLSALHVVYSTGLWRIYAFLFLYCLGFAILFPIIPTIITNGFASEDAGHAVECQKFAPPQPAFCRNAHAEAVKWTSWTSFVSTSLLSFLCAPNVGSFSDRHGRKPFMLVGMFLALLPMCALMLHVKGLIPIRWYYPCSALNGMVSSFSLSITSIADLLHSTHRATAVGYMSTCFSVGILVGPVIGAGLEPIHAVYTCIGMIGLSWFFVLLFVPETSPRCLHERRQQEDDRSRRREQKAREVNRSAVISALSWAKLEPSAAVAALEPAAPPPCNGSMSSRGGSQRASSLGGSSTGRSGVLGSRDDLEAPLLLNNYEREGSMVQDAGVVEDAAGKGLGVDPSLGSDQAGVHKAGAQGEEQDVEGRGGERCGPYPSANGDPRGEGQHGSGGDGEGEMSSAQSGGGRKGSGQGGRGSLMLVGFRLIWHSAFYRKLLLVWIIISMTWEGSQDMLIQYLQLALGFNTHDQAVLLEIMAACGLAIKVLLLASLVRLMGEKNLLMLGIAAYALQDGLLALAPTKATAFGAIAVGSFNCLAFPAVMALQTSRCDPACMGAVAGALQGMGALASGIGPVLFSWLFSAVTRTDGSLPYNPSIIWYVACAVAVLGVIVVASLDCSSPPVGAAAKSASTHATNSAAHKPTHASAEGGPGATPCANGNETRV
ncbi:major facilitator superfamily domain-containing protein [Dunaliella salina]|uniref:Major facilitator superfamily domain-containing protein n=1 Tax=Dunaliella salina TaxID=3046 RepID=A0ABQ7GLS4_DUNSA|nr:major facilitator superfamily domain-containing protein [Dunaliella salina]|eukprot:KAF5835498.1 major facilitator superfamily domain-containing protein [Dunaliella salina]